MKEKERKQINDLMKVVKSQVRTEYGFQPTKVRESKKSYNRKRLPKIEGGGDF